MLTQARVSASSLVQIRVQITNPESFAAHFFPPTNIHRHIALKLFTRDFGGHMSTQGRRCLARGLILLNHGLHLAGKFRIIFLVKNFFFSNNSKQLFYGVCVWWGGSIVFNTRRGLYLSQNPPSEFDPDQWSQVEISGSSLHDFLFGKCLSSSTPKG